MRIAWSERAEAHLARIYEFNLSRSLEWAEKVERRIRRRVDSLSQSPFSGRSIAGTQSRALSIPDIQYVIQYRVDAERVMILRVQSTREIQ